MCTLIGVTNLNHFEFTVGNQKLWWYLASAELVDDADKEAEAETQKSEKRERLRAEKDLADRLKLQVRLCMPLSARGIPFPTIPLPRLPTARRIHSKSSVS